jgi:hypothetical protein
MRSVPGIGLRLRSVPSSILSSMCRWMSTKTGMRPCTCVSIPSLPHGIIAQSGSNRYGLRRLFEALDGRSRMRVRVSLIARSVYDPAAPMRWEMG